MTFLDTGILVGAVLETHPRHAACLEGFDSCEAPFTNAHALAETFSTLTVEALSLGDYDTAIRESRAQGVMGGGIYDSLHATFSRRKLATRVVTLNPSHFQHVAPDIEILTP